ncbi:response regulator [Nocardioides sp.]|uniref:response regulator n=1 Tax=Nocardioides sp. TaxID=35761 RepID=UPI002B26BFFB|nr:response regulator [Nocardioides sp.]
MTPRETPRILLVEDEADIRTTLDVLLTLAGFEVVVACDGIDGLAACATETPDLVVLDVGLPGMDGWEVLRRLRLDSAVPVLVLTAHGLEAVRDRALAAGADAAMAKPFRHDELIEVLRSLLG